MTSSVHKSKSISFMNGRTVIAVAATLAMVFQFAFPFLPTQYAPVAHAATITVNSTTDAIADNGECTLREAIIAANTDTASGVAAGECGAGAGADIIELPAGTYTLTLSGVNAEEDAAALGDLDITADLQINGTGGVAIIDGSGMQQQASREHRIFDVDPAAAGITVSMSNLTIQNGFTDGTGSNANTDFKHGGGIFNGGDLTLTDVTIQNNQAESFGGGIINDSTGTLTLERVTINGNTSGAGMLGNSGSGGGIRNEAGGTINLTNVTISGNAASDGGIGGGIRNQGTANLVHVTIAGNSINGTGASGLHGVHNLTNVLIADNTGGNQCDQGQTETAGASLDTDGSCTVTVSNATADLGALASNGGNTQTHALGGNSAAIDGAPSSTCVATSNDQRGEARIDVPGVGSGTDNCDIGAYEFAPIPELSISPTSTTETNSGTTTMTFDVSISAAAVSTTTVEFATSDGTATTADNDYVASTGVITFPAGSSANQQITITVNGDTAIEPDEDLTVTLSNPTFATINTAAGTGTITNDDGASNMTIADATSVTEGDSGSQNMTFTVDLSAAQAGDVTVVYTTTVSGGATDATPGSDYTFTTGTLTFTAGVTSQSIDVPILGDTLTEGNELVFVDIGSLGGASAANVTITDNQGQGIIIDDDTGTVPSFVIADAVVTEGNSGTTSMVFSVGLSAAASGTVTVDYATSDGTATAGTDYTSTNGTLTFNAGETTKTITVTVTGDTDVEGNETFNIDFTNPNGALLTDNQALGTINGDDGAPNITIDDATTSEGDSGTVTIMFRVSLDSAPSSTVTVDYTTGDGTATNGSDYVSASGTVTFAPGETEQFITVTVNGDTDVEGDEAFSVSLSNAINAVIARATATGTIIEESNEGSSSSGGSSSSNDDDDDDGGSSAPPPPASQGSVPAASIPAPTATPAAEASMPAMALPETGIDGGSSTSFPWGLFAIGIAFGAAAVAAWRIQRRKPQPVVETVAPEETATTDAEPMNDVSTPEGEGVTE